MQTHQPPLVLLNYKAYHTLEDTRAHIAKLLEQEKDNHLSFCASIPYSFFKPLKEHFAEKVTFGADHMLGVKDNTFTASVAAPLLTNAEMKFVLIGSTYERQKKGVDDPEINQKLLKALQAGIHPILCLCDTEEEFEKDQSKAIMSQQLTAALGGLTPEQLPGLHILYDAAWINNAPWHVGDATLLKAYQNFNAALSENLTHENIASMNLLYAVPTFSPDLSEIVKALPAAGYSFGMLIAKETLDASRLPAFNAVQEATAPFMHQVPDIAIKKEDQTLEDLRSKTPDADTPILIEAASEQKVATSNVIEEAPAVLPVTPVTIDVSNTNQEPAPFKVVTEESLPPTAAAEVIDQITEASAHVGANAVSSDEEPPSPTIWEEFPTIKAKLDTQDPPSTKPKKSKTTRRVSPLTDFVSDAEFDL